jgi:hypothetical protein
MHILGVEDSDRWLHHGISMAKMFPGDRHPEYPWLYLFREADGKRVLAEHQQIIAILWLLI